MNTSVAKTNEKRISKSESTVGNRSNSKKILKINDDRTDTNISTIMNVNKNGIRLILDENMNECLCNNGNKITKIYHMADIHISRHNNRHEEYMTVFHRLIDEINKDINSAIIVICGDILHEKHVMEADQLSLVKKFFIMLSNLLPIIVIIGNHDINYSGNNINSISAILESWTTKHKIHLLLDDKNYTYNNLIFGVTTMFSKKVTPCINNDRNDKIRIGLYHGMIRGFNLENDYVFEKQGMFTIDDFKKYYDYTLLGDIHKYGYVDDEKTIAYPGSLIQQHKKESLIHGIIKWDLLKGTSKFIKIDNDYGFVKIKVNKDNLNDIPEIDNMPKFPTIYVEYDDILLSEAEKYLTMMRQNYNAKCELVRSINKDVDIKIGRGDNKKKLTELNNNGLVLDLIVDFMKSKLNHDEKIINLVKVKIVEILESLDYNYDGIVKNFKLKRLKFDNFFNYGEGNELDYTKMNGIIGFDGPVNIGKSVACADVLLYAIFGDCSRGSRVDAINVNKKYVMTDIEFELNGDTYRIYRKRYTKSGKRNSSEQHELYKNEIIIGRGQNINKMIEKILCNYNIFLNVAIMLQNNSASFVSLTHKERKDLICEVLNLDIFNMIHANAEKQKKYIKKDMNTLANINNDQKKSTNDDHIMKDEQKEKKKKETHVLYDKTKIDSLKTSIESIEIEYDKLNNETMLLQKDIKYVNDEIFNCTMRLKELNFDKNEYVKLKNDYVKITQDVMYIKNDYMQKTKKLTNYKNKLFELKQSKENCDVELNGYTDIESLNVDFQKKKQKDIDILTKNIENQLIKRSPIITNIPNVEKCLFEFKKKLKSNKATIEKYEANISDIKKQIAPIKRKKNMDDNYALLISYETNYKDHNDAMFKMLGKINKLQLKFKKLESHEYDANCKFCMAFPLTQEKIECSNELKDLEIDVAYIKQKIDVLIPLVNKYAKYRNIRDEYFALDDSNTKNKNEIIRLEHIIENLKKDQEIIENKLAEYVRYEHTVKDNDMIDKEIKMMKKKLALLNESSFDEYIVYHTLKEKRTKLINEISDVQTEIYKLDDEIKNTQNNLDDLNNKAIRFDACADMIVEYEELCIHIEYLNRELEIFNNQLNINNEKLNMEHSKLITEKTNLKHAEDILVEYEKKENMLDILDVITNAIGKSGLIESILTNTIIPKLEADLNNLLYDVMKYRISISYSNDSFKINKIVDGKIINISTISGGESIIVNICFKLVLESYNNHIKTAFLVIDELLNCADINTLNDMKPLFERIRMQYELAIIVSHDDNIKAYYDETINVTKKNGFSLIKYV